MSRVPEVLSRFRARFGSEARVYRAPGRVNLIGEHTDYNDGFVMPAAIGFSCWTAVAPRDDRTLMIHSENVDETVEADLDELFPLPESAWANYPLGVAWALEQAGNRLRGANVYIAGDVPLGAGLSSSAAIEVSVGYALLNVSGHPIDRTALALLCQRAENEFVGARCGIMDQFVSCNGVADHALMLDCRSLEMRLLPVPLHIALIICNTMVRHELAATEYNSRRAECEEAVRILARVLPGIRALRDVMAAQLEEHSHLLPDKIFRRARHIVLENTRVLKAADAFQSGQVENLGKLMADSHRSLRDDFEVSCPELDAMVEIAARQRGVFGARMTGGGFGGCTINLVEAVHAQEFQKKVTAAYTGATGLRPDIYVCKASQGAEAVRSDAAGGGNGETRAAGRIVSGEGGGLLELQTAPHRRFNPLLRGWVLVSPHRTQRPWQGKVEKVAPASALQYDPDCYLCPGNERAGGARNPKYTGTFVFDNDYPALLPGGRAAAVNDSNLIVAESEAGICRVGCFSPRHDLTIASMSPGELRATVDMWAEQFLELEKTGWVRHVQIFENRGALMGASNPHPHCQIWANATVPNITARELESVRQYREEKKSCLLCDYLQLELKRNERVVCQNDAFAVVVPFWAVWPFETLVLSKRHFAAISDLSDKERDLLGDILRRITTRYDSLFQTAFPYSMGFHQRPTDGQAYPEWHFHGHYFPPLLRSATVQKFMVGYEMLGSPQRDITPESAAQRLAEAEEKNS